jgi:TolB-like protein/DNA-binding winged helix-turn-helix (wHTH) protein/Flp pilus assembly protein TadD
MESLTHGFQLDGLKISPLTGEISGPGGTCKLDPRVMDVLVHMAGSPRQVVLREELVNRLWGSAVVTDDAVTRCFYELRRNLAHAGGNDRYRHLIETVPKRGYRLNASVVPGLPAPSPPASDQTVAAGGPRRPWKAVAAAAALLVAIGGAVIFWKSTDKAAAPAQGAVTHSIAVLPFLDMSEGRDQPYLADGMTEEILNHLAQASNLRVIARTSSFALRDMKLDVKEIGKRLGVEYVLEGSVRRSGERVRITAQLIDASTNLHAWSQTYDRTLNDLFAVQDEIAASVASALEAEISDGAARIAAEPDFEAYEQFLMGQTHFHRRGPGDVERAVAYYRRAVAIDPQFAKAWAALAGAYSLVNDARPGDKTFWDSQGAAARRAVELEPGLATAHARLAQYLYRTGAYSLAQEHFRKAKELDPHDPLVLGFSTSSAVFRGDLPAAIDIWRQLVARDPLSAVHRHNLGNILLVAGQPVEALPHLRAAVELNPASDDNRIELARGLILAGDSPAAARLILERPPGLQRDLAFALLARDPEYGQQARAILAELKVPPSDVRASVGLAEAHAHNGDHEAAFRVVEAALAESERLKDEMPNLRSHLRENLLQAPFLVPLHDDPRWTQLVVPPDPEAN